MYSVHKQLYLLSNTLKGNQDILAQSWGLILSNSKWNYDVSRQTNKSTRNWPITEWIQCDELLFTTCNAPWCLSRDWSVMKAGDNAFNVPAIISNSQLLMQLLNLLLIYPHWEEIEWGKPHVAADELEVTNAESEAYWVCPVWAQLLGCYVVSLMYFLMFPTCISSICSGSVRACPHAVNSCHL